MVERPDGLYSSIRINIDGRGKPRSCFQMSVRAVWCSPSRLLSHLAFLTATLASLHLPNPTYDCKAAMTTM